MNHLTWKQKVLALVIFTAIMGIVGHIESTEPVTHDAQQDVMEGMAWAHHQEMGLEALK